MIGLVVVTFNAAPHIARCLGAIAAQTRRPDRIILFDNASGDGTVAVARGAAASCRLAVEFVEHDRNLGFAAANNRAAARFDDCEFIALLNPDAFPAPGWLEALEKAAADHPEAASFAGPLLLADREGHYDGAGDVLHVSGLAWRVGHARRIEEVPEGARAREMFSACGAAALYRRTDWMRVGGFDERFFCYAEDVDLGFRLQLIGRPCRYVPEAVASHVGGAASGRRSAFAIYHGHRNLEWTFLKNMPTALLLRYLPLHVVVSLAAVVWFALTGAATSIVRAKWDAMAAVPAILAERRHVQATREISDRAVLARLDRSSLLRRFRDRLRSMPR